ncbi:hypothetical protein OROMI_009679 [Orobanche minor]
MFQPTNGNGRGGTGGEGVGVGGTYSNGYLRRGGGADGGDYGHMTGRPGRSRDHGGSSNSRVPQQQQQEKDDTSSHCTNYDVAYFHSYAHLGIHEEMIKYYDRVRTETYRNAIFQHQERIAGKVVVDVGCGTGILSIFCAQAGARRVYAVDASDIAVQANEVIKANNLSDTIIVLHGRVEFSGESKENGSIKGFIVGKDKVEVPHLQFDHGTVFFINSDADQLRWLVLMLRV